MSTAYAEFLKSKQIEISPSGFSVSALNDQLFEFQGDVVRWSIERGRAAIFADCGLGKTPMQLVWAEAVTRELNKPGLILAPLAVSKQTEREGKKFGIEVKVAASGDLSWSRVSRIFVVAGGRVDRTANHQRKGPMAEEEHRIISLRCMISGHVFDYNADLGAVAIGCGAACTPCMDRLFAVGSTLYPTGERPQRTRKKHEPFRHNQRR